MARHLLVDGSNLVHAWPELRALRARSARAARARLADSLGAIHDAEGIRVTLVFDGQGSELTLEEPSGQPTFAVVTSPAGMTADDVIERWVGKSPAPADCVVATNDRAERQTVEALGASSISADDLASWVRRAEDRLRARLEQQRRKTDRRWREPGGA